MIGILINDASESPDTAVDAVDLDDEEVQEIAQLAKEVEARTAEQASSAQASIDSDGAITISLAGNIPVAEKKEEEEAENEPTSTPLGDAPVFNFIDGVKVGECLNITSVVIPKEMENNVPTGHEKMDILMSGDGATPSTACLVTGVPGSGKTTLMLQMADSITKTGSIALYNSCEESMVQISRVAKRLRLKHGFFISSHRSVFDLIQHATTIQEQNPGKQVFLFVDSLQTIEIPNWDYDENGVVKLDENGEPKKRKGRPINGSNVQVEATKLLTNWCKRTYGIMFLIGQVNKDGDFAGRQAIKHWVDAHLHLDINRDRYSGEYGCRIAEMTKNRFGIAGIFYPFEIEARGIKFTEKKDKDKP